MKTEMDIESWIAPFMNFDGHFHFFIFLEKFRWLVFSSRLALAKIIKLQIRLQKEKATLHYMNVEHWTDEHWTLSTQVFNAEQNELIARSVFHALSNSFSSLKRTLFSPANIFIDRLCAFWGKRVHSKRIFFRCSQNNRVWQNTTQVIHIYHSMLRRLEFMKSELGKRWRPCIWWRSIATKNNWKHSISNTSVKAIVVPTITQTSIK